MSGGFIGVNRVLPLMRPGPVQAHFERSDVCLAPPAGVIREAMAALVLADAWAA